MTHLTRFCLAGFVGLLSATTLGSASAQAVIPVEVLVGQIEAAHQTDTYLSQKAVQADFDIEFPDMLAMSGTMWFTPAVGKTRLELDDGTVIVFDGQTAWVAPASEASPMARFHALTWPYFAALPHKMTEPGVHLESVGVLPAAGERMPAVKMTFDDELGDAPDDWYYVFSDERGVVRAASYIVTFGKTAEEAEEQASIVLYQGYELVDGVPIPTEWVFGFWDEESGMGLVKGAAELSDVRFVDPPAGAFDRPEGAVEVAMPGEGG